MGNHLIVEENAVAQVSRLLLERQCDQIAEASVRQRVLIRKEPIVGTKTNVRTAFHRFSQNE